jgi:hypothetical protein
MSGFSPEQLQAIQLLANNATHVEVARVLGVSTKTIQRWSKRADFIKALESVQDLALEKTIETSAEDISSRIQNLIPKALNVLEHYIEDSESRGSDRLRACHIVGSWAGLNQIRPQTVQQTGAEETLKGYLQYLANGNNNGSTSKN